MELTINLASTSYKIILKDGCLTELNEYVTVGDYIIITDHLIPKEYVTLVAEQLKTNKVITVKAGEASKSLATYQSIAEQLYAFGTKRSSTLVALGGGVIGDLTGFVAATYLRGIKYLSLPTSTLAQIDSSIGGKTGINFLQTKNILGAFHHPSLVLIDFSLLATLPKIHYYNGLIEALKMGIILDETLFNLLTDFSAPLAIEEIVYRSLLGKKQLVEQDEKEHSMRKLLNLGHTIGHALESYYDFSQLYHGEAVLLGMIYFSVSAPIRAQLLPIAQQIGIKLDPDLTFDKLLPYIKQDKKAQADKLTVVLADQIGQAYLKELSYSAIARRFGR